MVSWHLRLCNSLQLLKRISYKYSATLFILSSFPTELLRSQIYLLKNSDIRVMIQLRDSIKFLFPEILYVVYHQYCHI